MTASLRLLRIEGRRNPGLFLFIPLAAIVWLLVRFATSDQVVLWPDVSTAVRDSAGVVGTVAAGLAAWVAGRGQRAHTTELLSTTSRPPIARHLAGWAATAAWGLLACVLGGAIVLVQAATKATWGAPIVSPLVIALLVTAASASWGYAAGVWISGRFTAPLSAIVIFGFLFLPGALGVPVQQVQNLSFFSPSYGSVFAHSEPDLSSLHTALLFSLTALALACIVLRNHRNIPAWGAAVAGAAATVAFVVVLTGADKQVEADRIPYEPLCAEAGIEICIHPAFEAVQAETVDVIGRLMGPLIGVPGAPARAEQRPYAETWSPSPGTLHFQLHESIASFGGGIDSLAMQISGKLAFGMACCDEAQEAVRAWLLQQAGVNVPVCEQNGGGGVCTGVPGWLVPEVERFAALEPEVRHAWLHDNYAALTRGELTLEDLP